MNKELLSWPHPQTRRAVAATTSPILPYPALRYRSAGRNLVIMFAMTLTLCGSALIAFSARGAHAAVQSVLSTQSSVATTAPTADEIHLFVANLAGAHENPAVDTPATGRAVLSLISDTLTYRLFVSDIVSVTASHIHEGAVGINGGVIFPLYTGSGIFDPSHPISGTLVLSPTQVAQLMAGNYYLNVHTSAAPSGEIRGQIQPYIAPTAFNALLLGANEPAPVATTAKGVAQFTLVNTNTLQYQVAVSDIVSVTASHIHFGPVGVNGPVAHALYTGTGLFDPDNPVSGTVDLSAGELVDLLTGYFYVNVHTSANPGGEIRGQIGGVRLFEANLTGAAETPPNSEIGSGRAILALSADAASLAYRVTVQDITDISASHIHRAPSGVAGPIVFPLFNSSGGGIFDAANPVSGTVAISIEQVMALIGGDYYVNVHTPSHPPGALRGQIHPMAVPPHLLATLTGNDETPAVETGAVGVARLTVNDAVGTLHYSVAVTDITATASHIHLAPKGTSGGVIFPLYNSSSGLPFDGDHPIAGAVMPAATEWVDLLTGYYYVNVHSSAHPTGEIRGQLGTVALFEARLAGTGEVPPVVSSATGHAIMALNSTATTLAYRVLVEDIAGITASHIHRGSADVSGPVVVPLFTGTGSFDPNNPISGTVAMDNAMVFALLQGDYYVNVHTSANPSGEIRGQLEPYRARNRYVAHLGGEEEVPPVTTDARGEGYFYLTPSLGILHYTIAVTDIVSATASHIHLAPIGTSGGVIFPLFNASSGATLDDEHPLGGALQLNAQNLVDLLTGYYYVNVHTADVPSGAIRGQISAGHARYLPIIANK